MALNWSMIITGVLGLGSSILSLIKTKKEGDSNDDVSNSGFWIISSSSKGGVNTTQVNPLVWLIGGVVLLVVLLRRKK